MKDYILRFYSSRFLSKWIILLFDIVVIYLAMIAAIVIRSNFEFPIQEFSSIWLKSLWVTAVYVLLFLLVRPYDGIIRHTGLYDAFRIFKAATIALLLLLIATFSARIYQFSSPFISSYSVIIIHYLLGPIILVSSRVMVKYIYSKFSKPEASEDRNVVIYGAGSSGVLTRNALMQDKNCNYNIIAFLDDNPSKNRKTLLGVSIYSPFYVLQKAFIKKHKIDLLIIAMQDLSSLDRRHIIEKGLDLDLQVKIVPKSNLWINEKLSAQQIREVNINELLEREPIQLDSYNISKEIKDKVVMITGAAGSIGSEICRQVIQYHPANIVLLDQAESPMFDLQYEIEHSDVFSIRSEKVNFVIGDTKDRAKIDRIIKTYQPDIIYHAAAYKHVPLMENSPYEAISTNIFGTKNMADLAVKYNVKKFVFVSTDKAVNPTSVMGASKRISEIYTQSLSNGVTQFVTTRFGNVLGSNGSVIPTFSKQILEGGPVTITHKEITRFFMTIPEACNLVLEAGAMGKGGEIFVFDMGSPIKIYDLAKKMIQLSGFKPDIDIKIEVIGLRPGEKLYEEVLDVDEDTLPTYHPKITRAKVRRYTKKQVIQCLFELSELLQLADRRKLVAKMKDIVPEFISNNSEFEKLDKKTTTNISNNRK